MTGRVLLPAVLLLPAAGRAAPLPGLHASGAPAGFVPPDGRLPGVQPAGSTPVSFDPDHTEPCDVVPPRNPVSR